MACLKTKMVSNCPFHSKHIWIYLSCHLKQSPCFCLNWDTCFLSDPNLQDRVLFIFKVLDLRNLSCLEKQVSFDSAAATIPRKKTFQVLKCSSCCFSNTFFKNHQSVSIKVQLICSVRRERLREEGVLWFTCTG